MSRLHHIEKTRFLGREFLLWLWFTSERNGSMFELEEHGEVEIFLDDKIVLEPIFGEGNRHALSGFDPATSPEAAIALQCNKIPAEVKLKVVLGARAWSLSVRGDDLQIRSLKIPEVLSQQDDDRLAERLYLLEEIEAILLAVYKQFLLLRMGGAWEDRLHAIQEWIEEKMQESSLA